MDQISVYAKYASTYERLEDHGIGYQNDNRPLVINSAGVYDGRAIDGSVVRPNGRKDYFLCCVDKGKIYVRGEGKTFVVASGCVLLFRPGERQEYWYDKDEYPKNCWIHFTGSEAEHYFSQMPSGLPQKIGHSFEIGELTDKIIDEINNRLPAMELYCISYFTQIAACVARWLALPLLRKVNDRNDLVYKSLAYIRSNYSGEITVQELANMCYLSVNRYSYVFKELVGVSPQRFVINCKLQKAIELMTTTDINTGKIAMSIGYENQMYFSRLFKKYMGMTPTSFRQRAKFSDSNSLY